MFTMSLINDTTHKWRLHWADQCLCGPLRRAESYPLTKVPVEGRASVLEHASRAATRRFPARGVPQYIRAEIIREAGRG
jgi:hypothetical protein